jgi:hypothetical protein
MEIDLNDPRITPRFRAAIAGNDPEYLAVILTAVELLDLADADELEYAPAAGQELEL